MCEKEKRKTSSKFIEYICLASLILHLIRKFIGQPYLLCKIECHLRCTRVIINICCHAEYALTCWFLEQKLFCISLYTVITAPHIYFWHRYRYYLNIKKKILYILLLVLLRFIPQLGTLYKIALSYFTNQYRIE